MLKVFIPGSDSYDEVQNKFIETKGQTLVLEHSLVSISKWESKWQKPFISKKEKTLEETIDYVRCMCISTVSDESIFNNLTNANIVEINEYIESPMTATWFNDKSKQKRSNEVITSELIYYWMIMCNIPFECQKWHLNRLLTLIQVCNVKNTPPKKMSKNAILNRNHALNQQRRQQFHSKG